MRGIYLLLLAASVACQGEPNGSSPPPSSAGAPSAAAGTATAHAGTESGAGGSLMQGGGAGYQGLAGAAHAGQAPKAGKLEPADGQTLLVIGQDTASIDEYIAQLGVTPAGVMLYTDIAEQQGIRSPADNGAGVHDLQHWRSVPGQFVIQVGLSLVGSLDGLAGGNLDERVDALAEALREAERPIFLRVGYEFDSDWAGYEPEKYRVAYRRLVDRFRQGGAENVAFVWHAWGYFHSFGQASVAAWYPGDDYVDWVGVSLFPGWDQHSKQSAEVARVEIAGFAREHLKPLMVAESAPKQEFQPSRGPEAWSGWYEPVLDFIALHDVKMFSYINANWDVQPMWAGKGWGDTRVQTNPYVLSQWQAHVAAPRFVQSHPKLYESLGD